MSLTNYGTLKTAVASYTHRSDLTTVIPDFITLAEKRIVNDLIQSGGHALLEDSTALAFTSYEATLPTDFSGIRFVYTNDSTPKQIKTVTPEILKTRYSTAGTGKAGAIIGNKYACSPDVTSATLYYYATPVAMSADSDTNNLFPTLANAYLYGALIEANLYTKQDPSQWVSAYQAAMDSAVKTNKRANWACLTVVAA